MTGRVASNSLTTSTLTAGQGRFSAPLATSNSALTAGRSDLSSGNYLLMRFTSSRRHKSNITDLNGSLGRITALRPKTFTSTHEADAGLTLRGLIAEEVYEVIPEVVSLDDEGRPDSISLDGPVPDLIGAVRELDSRIRRLEGASND